MYYQFKYEGSNPSGKVLKFNASGCLVILSYGPA